MRKILTILFSAGLMFFLSLPANASIVNCTAAGSGGIAIDGSSWTPVGAEYEFTINGAQNGKPGYVSGAIETDVEGFDPTVRIVEYVTNDTTYEWTDYHIAIGMDKVFSILDTGLTMPSGWTAVITAVAPGTTPSGGTGWVGMVDYYQSAGSTVAIGDEGSFGLKVSFDGTVLYCTQQNPTPEPVTFALLGLGALALRRRK